MEDIEMENNNINNINIIKNDNPNNNNDNSNNNNNHKKEDSYSMLDNIQNELNIINSTFLNSINFIEFFSPFIAKGKEPNMEKTETNDYAINIPNYQENRNNFDNQVNEFSSSMNEHFKNILDLVNKLKKFDEFNKTEDILKENLEKLRQKNNNSANNMENKLKSVEKILNGLNFDASIANEIDKREQFDDEVEYIDN